MAITTTMRVMILVKAAPVLTSQLQESMCVAAMSLDDPPRWIRLHPVPVRDLEDTTKFRKDQDVTVEVRGDRQPAIALRGRRAAQGPVRGDPVAVSATAVVRLPSTA